MAAKRSVVNAAAWRRGTTGSHLAEHLVEFAAGITVGEFGERPLLRHLLRRLHEAGPRHPRQRATDADAADAEIACDLQRGAGRADQEIDGLWMYRFHNGRNLFSRRDAGR